MSHVMYCMGCMTVVSGLGAEYITFLSDFAFLC
jgi:hypothetical protein